MRSLPPFLKILPLVVAGILLGNWADMEPWMVAPAAGLCTLLACLLRRHRFGELYIALSVVLWAMCATALRAPHPATTPQHYTLLTTTITSTPYTSGRWQRCDAQMQTPEGSLRVLLRADTAINLSLGERATADGYLRPLPEGSYGDLMRRRGYYGTLYISSPRDYRVTDTATSATIAARRVQQSLLERIDRLGLEEEQSAVTKAMLLGFKGGITPSLREVYSRSGASHLLAISGLHVGIVAMLVWWLCWLLPLAGSRGHIVRNLTVAVIMVLYAILTGLSPSVVRATLMFLVAQLTIAYGTTRSSLGILCGALTMMLLVNPNNLYDISFTLSAVAVIGICAAIRPAEEFFGFEHIGRLWRPLLGVVLVGLCSTLATLPLVAHTFGIMSLVGIFLNPVVIVTAQIIVLGGLIWVSLPLPILAPVMRAVVGTAAEVQNRMVEYAASLPWAALEVTIPRWVVVVCYVAMLAGLVVAMTWKERKIWRVEEKS